MHWTTPAVLIGLLAAVSTSAPLFSLSAPYQQPFSSVNRHCPDNPKKPDCGITYLPPSEHQTSGEDLNDQMQDIIDDEMGYRYYPEKYRVALMEDLCKPKLGFRNLVCNVTILEDPTIEIIPAQPISQLIYCSTPTCRVSYSVTQTVSTTHSNSIGFSGSAGATPFGVGMQFTASTGYEFSSTTEKATELGYEFQINRGESGYVAIVGVQVSARARFESCPCELQGDGRVSWKCKIKCRSEENWTRKEGYHESIIKQNGGVKGIVSFIYT
ncbi:hypothetical protein BKA57DRAFT_530717 [Linnemannia elongata]|uniref:Ubiquitin 3 binding protein But2 C-terminal domain-containing protein n=1 Tax=Linnemannia elongata AG-77 TaxID=1314771 RepID=A0A197KBU7_9FUNG|nr:hypothetical protein BGZ88_009040 [Linnemannia elongata]KAG0072441.1 hypothetical protein BGZ89_006252 [Linnemannia elongata]KAH7060211.1 hypothetical protein BKA57DRAFT_530717 [Linnemannia elongata]OAQ34648.1 hypothetical protein K457DRAFT_152263 [Linnemannia elongata AG-77]